MNMVIRQKIHFDKNGLSKKKKNGKKWKKMKITQT